MIRTLITNATAFLGGTPVEGRGVLIANGKIVAVGDSAAIAALPEAVGAEHIDARGGLLHASFADAHVPRSLAALNLDAAS